MSQFLCISPIWGEYITVGLLYNFSYGEDVVSYNSTLTGQGSWMTHSAFDRAVRDGKIVVR